MAGPKRWSPSFVGSREWAGVRRWLFGSPEQVNQLEVLADPQAVPWLQSFLPVCRSQASPLPMQEPSLTPPWAGALLLSGALFPLVLRHVTPGLLEIQAKPTLF